MNKTVAIIGVLVALAVGYVVGNQTSSHHSDSSTTTAAPVAAAAPDSSVERFKVPIGTAPVRGPATAKITVVEFSDYQCPFCGRVEPTLDQLRKAYGKEIRIAFKNNPLPFHPNAAPA